MAPAQPYGQPVGVVRVTVNGEGRRRDLVLPARVPVAELVPGLGTALGVSFTQAPEGWTLVCLDGRSLDPESALQSQGVVDGAVLTLVPTIQQAGWPGSAGSLGHVDGPVHDDVGEAVAAVVAELGPRWSRPSTRRATQVAAAVLSGLVLAGLATQTVREPSAPGWVTATVVGAVVQVVAGAVLARTRRDIGGAITLLLLTAPYAVVSGAAVGPGEVDGWPLAGAGTGAVTAGLVGPLVLGRGHWVFLVPGVLGAAAVVVGATHSLTGLGASPVAAVLTVAVVVLGRFVPWAVLAVAGSALTPTGPTSRAPLAYDQVRRCVGRSHGLVLGVTTGVAVVVTVAAPLLVGLGEAGLGIVWAAGASTVLRARQLVLGLDVAVGVVGGGAALVSGTVSALVLHPDWSSWVMALVGTGALLMLGAMVWPPRPSARATHLLDLLEGLALGALLPLLVVAIGLATAARGGGG